MNGKPRPQAGPPDAAALARHLLRTVPMATLATADAGRDGWPHASLAAVANTHVGTPVLLLSRLSEHTRNLDADARAALLLDASEGLANRMAGERLTVSGRLRPMAAGGPRDEAAARYLRRHPGARAYADFGDFAWYAMAVERAHLIGGFAKAYELDASTMLPPLPADYGLAQAEEGILEHMNDDHRDTVQLYANALARRPGNGWYLTGIDGWGIDLKAGGGVARIPFAAPIVDAQGARRTLMALAEHARTATARG